MKVFNHTKFNNSICTALGIDPETVESVTLHFFNRELPLVTVSFLPDHEKMERVADVLKQYTLMETK